MFSPPLFHRLIITFVAIFMLAESSVLADYTLYTLPGTGVSIPLAGRVKYNPGGTATLRHPRGTLYFNARDIRVMKTTSVETLYTRRARPVLRSGDVDQMLELAEWALQKGLLDKTKEILSAAWKIDPQHRRLRKIALLSRYLNQQVSKDPASEQDARRLVGGNSMEVSYSKHYLLLHTGDTTKDKITKKTRAEMRLELLEKVYETYFLTFAFGGKFLRPPTKPMIVVLFSDHADFMLMERRLQGSLKQVAGFYMPKENVAIYYDTGTTPEFKAIASVMEGLGNIREQARRQRSSNAGEIIRFVDTLNLLLDIARESSDISVVSHEAVHQLAGNTSLFPRDKVFIRWMHEGLASYFESAKLATWGGVGNVDEERIAYYRALEGDSQRGSLEFIVSDLGFAVEASVGDQRPAYGQAWSLTHFLMNRRFDELMTFYERAYEIPTDMELKEKGEMLLEIFDDCFGDRDGLEIEWRRYMRSLKTELELLAEENR